MNFTKSLFINKENSISIGELKLKKISEGEVLIEHSFVGMSRYDTEILEGKRKPLKYPCVAGSSAVGVVVKSLSPLFKKGDEVFYFCANMNGYCTHRIVRFESLFSLKDYSFLSKELVASISFDAFTAMLLANFIAKPKKEDSVLINGASGRVGRILTRVLSSRGVSVISCSSDQASLDKSKEYGCSDGFIIDDESNSSNYISKCSYAFDFLGGEFLLNSIRYVKKFGLLVSVGKVCLNTPVIPTVLLRKSCVYLQSFSTYSAYSWGRDNKNYIEPFFNLIKEDMFKSPAVQIYSLEEYKEAIEYIKTRPSSNYVAIKIN